MPAEIDIIVSSPDSTATLLIVETKLRLSDFAAAEAQLRSSMLQLACPVGLLVTPEKLWVYADRFRSTRPESIERVGEFPVGHLLAFNPPESTRQIARLFESHTQRWLENLPRIARSATSHDKELWQVLNKYVVPAIESGEVRAAAPRY